MAKPTPTEELVSNYLNALGVTVNTVLIGERKSEDWLHDAWVVSFTAGKTSVDFDYKTGTGHRKSKHPIPSDIAKLSKNAIARVNWEKVNLLPVKPPAADVLYCLISDGSAAHVSFADWCSDYGMDTDSRNALSIYEQCQQNGDKIKKVFSSEQLAKLSELLEDY